jgi:hypothetical protein
MKSLPVFAGAIGALTLALAVPVFAAPAAPPPQPGGQPGQPGAAMGHDRMGPGQMGRMGRMGPGRMGMRLTPEERAKRRADQFTKMDANKDGKVTEPEFRAFAEARKGEREHQMFLRFSGDQESVTLDQLNARALTRERAMENRMRDRRGGRGMPGARPAR